MVFQTPRIDAMKRAFKIFSLAACFAVLSAATGVAQESGSFVEPVIEASKTMGGLQFGGDADQLEDIAGEAVSEDRGNAKLSKPDFSAYGPVGGMPKSTADQVPALTPQEGQQNGRYGETIQSRSDALPNQYKGELIVPDWIGKSSESSPSGRRVNSSNGLPQRSQSKAALRMPRLRIDGMKAIENANRDFDSRSHEIVRERYPDGSVKIVRTIAQDAEGNYYNDGGWLMYDRQQRPIASGTFVRGAMEGDWERVHESGSGGLFSQSPFNLYSGPFLSRANFVRNKIDGVWSISDKSGEVICTITYQDGKRNGLASWFYPNGKPMRKATFEDGVPDGFVLQWDQQGNQILKEQFVDGRKVIRKKTTFANQTVASERVFQDQKLMPQGADNWWAAKPATFARDGEQVQHGPVTEWYPNRQPKMTGRYVDGLRDGLFTWWHETHNKKAEGEFSKGQRVGMWRYWYESGMKRSEGEFRDNEPFGVWRTWNADGKVNEEKTFPLEKEPLLNDADSEGAASVMDRSEAADSELDLDSEVLDFKVDVEDEADEPISNDDPFGEEGQVQDVESYEGIDGEPVPDSDFDNFDPGSLGGV